MNNLVLIFEYTTREEFLNDKYSRYYACEVDSLDNFIKEGYWYKIIVPCIVIAVVELAGITFQLPHYVYCRIKNNSLRLSSCVLKHLFGISKIVIKNLDKAKAIDLLKHYINCRSSKDVEHFLKYVERFNVEKYVNDFVL